MAACTAVMAALAAARLSIDSGALPSGRTVAFGAFLSLLSALCVAPGVVLERWLGPERPSPARLALVALLVWVLSAIAVAGLFLQGTYTLQVLRGTPVDKLGSTTASSFLEIARWPVTWMAALSLTAALTAIPVARLGAKRITGRMLLAVVLTVVGCAPVLAITTTSGEPPSMAVSLTALGLTVTASLTPLFEGLDAGERWLVGRLDRAGRD